MNFVPPWNITRKRLKGAIDAKGYGRRGERENLTQPNEDKWGGNENNYWARLALAHAPLLFQSLGVACPANFYTGRVQPEETQKQKNKIPVHTEAKKLRSNWWWNWRSALLDGRERLDCLGAFLPTFSPLRLLYSSCIIITFARSSLNLFLFVHGYYKLLLLLHSKTQLYYRPTGLQIPFIFQSALIIRSALEARSDSLIPPEKKVKGG